MSMRTLIGIDVHAEYDETPNVWKLYWDEQKQQILVHFKFTRYSWWRAEWPAIFPDGKFYIDCNNQEILAVLHFAEGMTECYRGTELVERMTNLDQPKPEPATENPAPRSQE